MPVCPNCGEDNPERARFCLSCGRPLEAIPVEGREVRKTVTVVFSDVTGSTSLGERLDPESMRRVMTRYFDEMRQVLERHGGTVEKFIGDAIMAVFGIPQLHEDDALRAVRAASEMRDALAGLNEDLERDWGVRIDTRTGVNTGEVVAGDPAAGQALVTGDAVNVAARLEQAARPGEILIGSSTYRLTRDAVTVESVDPLSLKGKAEAVPAHRLIAVTPGVEGVARRIDSPMVGRDGELMLLRQALDRVQRERGCHLFTILGPAGIGKTRLIDEFVAGLGGEAMALRGRALPYGEGITFWPVAEAVRTAAGILDEDTPRAARDKIASIVGREQDAERITERVAQVFGLEQAPGTAEETFWAVRKLFESMARKTPLVIVFDDGHWAEPTFLDLVEHVADWTRDAPILLMVLARPELLDQRQGWGGGKLNATSIFLEPLSPDETARLVDNLLGGAVLEAASRRRIVEASEGNPLFVEQLVAMLIDDGTLRRDDGHWVPTTDLSRVSVPPTIQALLAARLDRLGPEERHVMERAAVAGRVFYPGAVAELSQETVRPRIAGHLMTLVRKELIRPDRTTFGGEEAFRFRHLFVRDAAYEGMPKETRADLHERFADWLEQAAGERAPEYEEIVAYHLEQSYRYRSELGPADDRARALGQRAGDRLAAAGKSAWDRGDNPAAINLLSRAVALPGNQRGQLYVPLAKMLGDSGEFARAADVVAAAERHPDFEADPALRARLRLETAFAPLYLGSEMTAALREIESLIPLFKDLGEDGGLAEALYYLGILTFWAGQCESAERMLDEAASLAARIGDRRTEIQALDWMGGPIFFGPSRPEEGIRSCQAIMERAQGHPRIAVMNMLNQAGFLAMQGKIEEGRSLAATARRVQEDLGLVVVMEMHLAHLTAFIEMQAGDLEAAERHLRAGCELLDRLGERGFLSTLVGELGELVYTRGRYEEAFELSRESEAAAASDDTMSQAQWRRVRAKVLARRGDLQEARTLAEEAVRIARTTDYLNDTGAALRSLAEVLHRSDRTEGAADALREALALYERKGNLMDAERVREQLQDLAG